MGLISRFSQQKPGKQKMTREQLIGLIQSDAKFMNEREEIEEPRRLAIRSDLRSHNTQLSIGYRVKSQRGTQFRIWTQQLSPPSAGIRSVSSAGK